MYAEMFKKAAGAVNHRPACAVNIKMGLGYELPIGQGVDGGKKFQIRFYTAQLQYPFDPVVRCAKGGLLHRAGIFDGDGCRRKVFNKEKVIGFVG